MRQFWKKNPPPSTRTSVNAVSNNRVSCGPCLSNNFAYCRRCNRYTWAHFLAVADYFNVMLRTIKVVDKSVNDNSVHRLDHCDVIASCSEVRCGAQWSWTPNWFKVIYSSAFGIKHKPTYGLNSWRHIHQIQQVSLCPLLSAIRAIAFIQIQRGWQCSLDFQEQDDRGGG